jgi:Ala-tRNA(Pro) deacylase
MPVKRLKEYLDRHEIKYITIRHSPAYTAQEVAASAHIPGREMAKTVMIKIDDDIAMAVLPASFHVDLDRLGEITGSKRIALAAEDDFKDLFPSCEVGAMPPFGNLYDMQVFADASLAEDEEIAFEGGSHSELIRLPYADYVRLAEPVVVQFALEYV